MDPDRLGWMNKHNGGKPLGATISVTINNDTFDASTGNALILGFVNGLQYTGLEKEGDAVLPTSTVPLTNCFAAVYSLLEDFDIAGYNIRTFTSEPGTIKIFDVLAMDTSRIFMDTTVSWEMCDGAAILGQFKNMAGADYASIADNVTRELLVIAIESPEDRKTIQDIYAAGKCAKKVADDSGLLEDQEKAEEENNE